MITEAFPTRHRSGLGCAADHAGLLCVKGRNDSFFWVMAVQPTQPVRRARNRLGSLRTPGALVLSASLLLLVSMVGCVPHVRFPEPDRTIVLALRDPLFFPHASVEAVIVGASRTTLWMSIASGSEDVTLPEAVFREVAQRGPTTGRLDESGILPRLDFGALQLRDVVVHPGPSATLGQSVLSHGPWEIDWGRGTLVLNAPPWPEGTPQAACVPLRRDGFRDIVALSAGGHVFDMVVDTRGHTRIPDPLGVYRREEPALDFAWRQLDAEASLGSLKLGVRRFDAPISGHESHGTLGLAILSSFRFRVVPGREMCLQPSGDVRTTAATRVSRWDWTRGCSHIGCVEARVDVGPDSDTRPAQLSRTVVLEMERPYLRPALLVLGCGAAATVVMPLSAWGSSPDVGRRTFPPMTALVAPLGRAGRYEVPVDPRFRCKTYESLSLVEVIPLLASEPQWLPQVPAWDVLNAWGIAQIETKSWE